MENTVVLKGPVEYIKEAIKIYFKKENMIFFVKVMSFSTIFSSIATYINSYFTSSNMYVQRYDDVNLSILISIFTIISVVVTLWLQSCAFFSVLNMEKSVKDVVKMSIYKLLPFFGISFVLGLINIFGLLLLVVPAVIFGLWFSFTLYLYFEKGVRLTEALKTSKALVKGKMMKVTDNYYAIQMEKLTAFPDNDNSDWIAYTINNYTSLAGERNTKMNQTKDEVFAEMRKLEKLNPNSAAHVH